MRQLSHTHTREYARRPNDLHAGPTPRTRAQWSACGQRRPHACLVVYVRIKGLTRMFKGLGANNTPHPTSLCPKRRPPSPQQPIFSTSHRGDLHFGRYATSNKQLTNARRGELHDAGSDTPAPRCQRASCRTNPHCHTASRPPGRHTPPNWIGNNNLDRLLRPG